MNQVFLSGEIIREVEARTTNAGAPVTNFALAVKRPKSRDIVDYHECVAYDSEAEKIINEYKKGDWVFVSGYLTTHSNMVDGKKIRYSAVKVESVETAQAE